MKEREIFVEALERSTGTKRDAYLAEACAGDDALRAGVERLLLEHSRPGPSFLDEPVGQIADSATLTEESGEWIERYKLLQVIGEGGFGTVWMAEQKEPVRRKLALKIIKAGMDTKQVVARFEAERQALALMDHPSIARVYDGGATKNGRPYFVMELVKGAPITEYCDQAKLDMAGRLALFREVCHAVQHAHNKGVIHRDLKPSNVMVSESEGRPVPKVIDFGIAKATSSDLTQRTLFTEFRQFLGTPEYTAPEQAGHGSLDVDTRADVYSLGVLLYELLTGTKPFDLKTALDAGWEEMIRVIREQDPQRPSTRVSTMGNEVISIAAARHASRKSLDRLFRDDLDWIVLKALEKDRDRRYDTASGFADDIDRFLASEPVSASPPSRAYRFRKLARRNKKTFAVASVFLVALFFGITGTTYGMLRAQRAEALAADERDEAALQARRAEAVVTFLNEDLLASVNPTTSRGREITVREVLDNAARTIEAGLAGERQLEASIRATLGRTYLSLGDYKEARQQLLRTAVLATGEEPTAEVLRARAFLAELTRLEGRYDEAYALIEEVIEQQNRMLGGSHRYTFYSRLVRVRILSDRAQYDEAETSLLALIYAMQAALGEDDRDLLVARSTLGWLYFRQGRLDDAVLTYRDVLGRQREVLGEDHPNTLTSLGSLGTCLWQRKRYEEAMAAFSEQLAIRRRVLGEEHPITIESMQGVAMTLAEQERYQEAEAMSRKVLSLQNALLGPDAPASLNTLNSLALSIDRQGRYEAALSLYEEAARRQHEVYGPEQPGTLLARANMGAMLALLGRLDEAETIQREVLAIRRRVLGDDHLVTMSSIAKVLEILRKQPDRAEEARPLQREYLAYRERVAANPESGLGEKDLLAWELLVAIPEDLRDLARAREIIEEVLRLSPERKPQYLDTYALALFRTGDIERAIEFQREAIERAPEQSMLRIEFEKRLAEFEAAAEGR